MPLSLSALRGIVSCHRARDVSWQRMGLGLLVLDEWEAGGLGKYFWDGGGADNEVIRHGTSMKCLS